MKLKVMARGLWTASCCLFVSCLLLEIPAVISLPSSSGAKHSVTAFSSWAATKSHHNGNLCKHRISCIRGCHPQFDSGPSGRRRSVVLASMATTHHDETVTTNSTSSSSSSSKSSIPSDDCDCSPTPQSYTDTGSTAIILNMNARSVTPQLISIASNIVGENNVYITKTMDDAVLAARTVVRGCSSHTATTTNCKPDELQKYSLVVPVGGDGTLSGWIDTMVDEILLVNKLEQDDDSEYDDHTNNNNMTVEEAVEQLPLVGYIPMGTGNGLGYVIGCKASKDYHDDEDSEKKRSILSRIKVNRKKYERAYQVMSRLKEVGDAMQEAEQTNSQDQLDIAEKCTIVEMPLMEVTHPEIDEDSNNIIVEDKGDLCFFAGAGFDSLMLHDFYQIKSWSKSDSSTSRALPTFVKDALSSVTGYCVALVTKTLPQALRYGTHKIHVKVTTTDEDTLWVDHRRGDFSEPAVQQRQKQQLLNGSGSSSGDNSSNSTTTTKASDDQQQHLIYSGSTGIICAATTPYYGGGMRLFPYARLIPDKLQLRLGRISPLTGFFNIPKIFEGSYRETGETTFGCLDFIGKEFVVEVKSGRYDEYIKRQSEKKKTRRLKLWPWGKKKLDDDDDGQVNEGNIKVKQEGGNKKGFPFQHSGESMGIKERFRLRVVQKPVKFVSFLAPRVIVDD